MSDSQIGWPTPANLDFTTKHMFDENTEYICHNCSRIYKPTESTSEIMECFCTGLCQVEYRVTHNRIPGIVAEVPLGEPESCNLGASYNNGLKDMVVKAEQEFQATGSAKVIGYLINPAPYPMEIGYITPDWEGSADRVHADMKTAIMHLFTLASRKSMPVAGVMGSHRHTRSVAKKTELPQFSHTDVWYLKRMLGMKIEGSFTFPSGTHVAEPRSGYIWCISHVGEKILPVEILKTL